MIDGLVISDLYIKSGYVCHAYGRSPLSIPLRGMISRRSMLGDGMSGCLIAVHRLLIPPYNEADTPNVAHYPNL
jgi:hypothetical protein